MSEETIAKKALMLKGPDTWRPLIRTLTRLCYTFIFLWPELSLATGATFFSQRQQALIFYSYVKRAGLCKKDGNFAEWLSKGICVIYGDVIHGTWGAGADSVNSLFPYTQLLWSQLRKTMTRGARKAKLAQGSYTFTEDVTSEGITFEGTTF